MRMHRARAQRGLATVTAVVVLTLVLVLGFGMLGSVSQLLRLSSADTYAEKARMSAEAGVNDAMAQLRGNSAWTPTSAYTGKSLPANKDTTYTVRLANNSAGSATIVAEDGTTVPAGLVYIMSTGLYNGTTRKADVMLQVQAGLNPFRYAIFGSSATQTMVLGSGSQVDSYTPGSSTPSAPALVAGNGNIQVSNGSKVTGDVSSALTATVSGSVSGTVTNGASAVTWPPVTLPVGATATDLTVSGTMRLAPGTYYYHNLTVASGGRLNISSGPVILYVTGVLTVSSGGRLDNSTQDPTQLQIYSSYVSPGGVGSASGINLESGSDTYAAIYAPQAGFDMSSGGHLYGSAISSWFTMAGGSRIHYDTALNSLTSPITGSTPGVTVLSWERH